MAKPTSSDSKKGKSRSSAGTPTKAEANPKKNRAPITAEKLQQVFKEVARLHQASPQATLRHLLEEQNVESPIVIVSGEHLRAKRAIQWLKDLLPDAELSIYFGSDLNSASSTDGIRQELLAMSLFAKLQIVVLYGAEAIKAAAQKPLEDLLGRGNPNAILILTAESIPAKAGLLSHAAKVGCVVELTELKGPALTRWIEREVVRVGLSAGIDSDAAQLLTQLHSGDLSALAREIEKLSLLAVQGEKISRQMVVACSSQTPENSSFELVRLMAAKNTLSSATINSNLLEHGLHPLQISAFLSRAFRTMLAHKEPGAVPAGSELANPWFAKQLSDAERRFSAADLVAVIHLLTKLDFQLKDSRLPPELVLSNAVERITARHFRNAVQ